MAILSTSVDKLGATLPAFNLPVLTTCPGKTVACSKYCYARRHHYAMGKIKNKLSENFALSKRHDFSGLVIAELTILKQYYRDRGVTIDRFRIHTAGDFYSQAYLNKWSEVVKKFPAINFVAYTRSYKLDFSKMPKNLILYYSRDNTTKHGSPKGITRTATVIPKKELSEIIPEKSFICRSKCYKCKACYIQGHGLSVIFPKH